MRSFVAPLAMRYFFTASGGTNMRIPKGICITGGEEDEENAETGFYP